MRRKFTPEVDPEAKRRQAHAARLADRVEQYLRRGLKGCEVSANAYDFARFLEIRVSMTLNRERCEEVVVRNLAVESFTSKRSGLLRVAHFWRSTLDDS